VKWSVGVEAEGDRVLSREEIVELADAVAVVDGIATGIGTNRYGAQLVVQAGSRDEAIEKATQEFAQAAARAGLPAWPVARAEAVSEAEDLVDAVDLGEAGSFGVPGSGLPGSGVPGSGLAGSGLAGDSGLAGGSGLAGDSGG
jgi:hypothetical protein